MRIGDICTAQAAHCKRDITLQEAAQLMRAHHVGDLVVVEQPNGEQIPVGIITDRDIVVIVIAEGLDPTSITVVNPLNISLTSPTMPADSGRNACCAATAPLVAGDLAACPFCASSCTSGTYTWSDAQNAARFTSRHISASPVFQ